MSDKSAIILTKSRNSFYDLYSRTIFVVSCL